MGGCVALADRFVNRVAVHLIYATRSGYIGNLAVRSGWAAVT